MTKNRKCMICERNHFGLGFCVVHYHAYKNPRKGRRKGIGGWPKGKRRVNQEICKVDGCKKRVHTKNMCRSHYNLNHRNGNPVYIYTQSFCAATGCKRHIKVGSLFCAIHQRMYLTPRTNIRGDKNHRWNGGTSEYPNHYQMKKIRKEILSEANYKCQFNGPNCRMMADRVHHKNGLKKDHNKANFMAVCSTCHGFLHRGRVNKAVNKIRHGKKTYLEWHKITGLSIATIRNFFLFKQASYKTKLKLYHAGYVDFDKDDLEIVAFLSEKTVVDL
jgi:hypothetical protein